MPEENWKIAYVSPRYAPGAAGGAEVLIQNWAERMRERGHYSEVLTTCVRDHFTWENEYPPGEEVIRGVRVRRFPSDPPDHRLRSFYLDRIASGLSLSREEEEALIGSVAVSRSLCDRITACRDEFDFFIFSPYLFGLTYFGARRAPGKAIIVPCLHDEPFAYLKIIRRLFSSAAGIFFNSVPEREFAGKLLRASGEKSAVVGMGIEAPGPPDPDAFRRKYNLDGPFLFYAGRREGGKNTPLLIEYFRTFRRYRGTGLKLVLCGTGEVDLKREDRNSIRDLGYLEEAGKWDAYAASLAFCHPSTNESLSIVLLESWLTGKPALVNAFSPVTLDHCRRSGGGLYFRDYFEFEEALLYLLREPAAAGRMGERGREYVRRYYDWEKVLDRLETALGRCRRRQYLNPAAEI